MRVILEKIGQLVYYGNFSFKDVYQMPVQYREFFYNMLQKIKHEEKQEIEKGTK